MGKGAVISGSNKQKINTKSSTEAELVGVDDYMSKILNTRYFIESQGYTVGSNTIHQDNKSTILLEKNGRASSKRTRHINVRYFFITDRVQQNEVSIKYCPTKEMVADYFTKPLQGALFYKLRAMVMNMDMVNTTNNIDPSLQECQSTMMTTVGCRSVLDGATDRPFATSYAVK